MRRSDKRHAPLQGGFGKMLERTLFNLVWFMSGVAAFWHGSLDGKLLGVGMMLYGMLSHAVDSLAVSLFESLDELEKRLANIETLLVDKSN
jgi:hypothetical protein